MQEVIKLVSTIRQDIAALSSQINQLTRTHVQILNEEWITRDQVQKLLKIGARTVETMKRNGELPYSKIHGMIYFRARDIGILLDRNYSRRSVANNPQEDSTDDLK